MNRTSYNNLITLESFYPPNIKYGTWRVPYVGWILYKDWIWYEDRIPYGSGYIWGRVPRSVGGCWLPTGVWSAVFFLSFCVFFRIAKLWKLCSGVWCALCFFWCVAARAASLFMLLHCQTSFHLFLFIARTVVVPPAPVYVPSSSSIQC